MLSVDIKKKVAGFTLDVSFECGAERLGLLGVSGCGKSMTLKCIAGIEKPDSGRIVLDGNVLYDSEKKIDLRPQQRSVGYLFQQYALFPNMTVQQNIAICVSDRKKADAVAAEMIKKLGLSGLEHKRPGNLSGGQQQRTALARILVNEPKLLLLDEPFSALDSFLKWELETQLSDMLRSYGGVSVFVSHNRHEIYRICDSVCVLSGGKSEPVCSVKQLFERPKTVAGCKLAGFNNFTKVERVSENVVKALDWDVDLNISLREIEQNSVAAIRAEKVVPASPGDVNVIEGTVFRVTEDEKEFHVTMRTKGGGDVIMEIVKGLDVPEEGSVVAVSVKPEDIVLVSE